MPASQDSGHPGQDSAIQIGVPSDRVLGVPVAAAMNPLPETCCTQQCFFQGKPFMNARKRIFLWRLCLVMAATVILFTACADALSSKEAIWNAAASYDDAVTLTLDLDTVPGFYLKQCQTKGLPPQRVEVSFYFLVFAAVLISFGTIIVPIVSQGCLLCCAPCACWDFAARVNTALGFSIPLMVASLCLLGWNIVHIYMDMANCKSCFEGSQLECSKGFFINKELTGFSVSGGVCGAVALTLVGFYCLYIPKAIQDAVRFKARNITAIQSSISLNSYIGYRAMAVSPNLLPFNREAALSAAASMHGSAATSPNGPLLPVGQPSPFMQHQMYQFSRTASQNSIGSMSGASNSRHQPSPLIIAQPPREALPTPPRPQGSLSGGTNQRLNPSPIIFAQPPGDVSDMPPTSLYRSQVHITANTAARSSISSSTLPPMIPTRSTALAITAEDDGEQSYVLRSTDMSASDTVWTDTAVGNTMETLERPSSSMSAMSNQIEQLAGRFTVLSASLQTSEQIYEIENPALRVVPTQGAVVHVHGRG